MSSATGRKPGIAVRPGYVKQLRDSHHMVARLVASGMRPHQVAQACGYTTQHVSCLYSDPSFKQLVAEYRRDVDQTWREGMDTFLTLAKSNMLTAERLLNDKLSTAEPDDVSIRELVLVSRDAADRFGYAKRSQVDLKVDFAAQLDRAISRSGVTIDQPRIAVSNEEPLPSAPTLLGAQPVPATSADASQPQAVHLPAPYINYPTADPLPPPTDRLRRI